MMTSELTQSRCESHFSSGIKKFLYTRCEINEIQNCIFVNKLKSFAFVVKIDSAMGIELSKFDRNMIDVQNGD